MIIDVTSFDKSLRPEGRKLDPSGFSDPEFYVWRNRLTLPTEPAEIKYKVAVQTARIRTAPNLHANIVGRLHKNDIFYSQAVKLDEHNAYVSGINTWAHITRGFHNKQPVDGLGFIHTSNLILVG